VHLKRGTEYRMKIKTSLIATNFELLHSAVVDGTIKTNIEIEKVAFVN